MISKLSAFASLALVAALLVSCEKPDGHPPAAASGIVYYPIGLDGHALQIELAITSREQQKGVMGREGIPEDHGMLFVYTRPQSMSYWMKNVDFPIDIGFFTADGILREVYPMYANDTSSRKSMRDDLLYALEMRHKWFRDHQVRPGAKLDLDDVEKALAQRRSVR